jgi:hypothetical protein
MPGSWRSTQSSTPLEPVIAAGIIPIKKRHAGHPPRKADGQSSSADGHANRQRLHREAWQRHRCAENPRRLLGCCCGSVNARDLIEPLRIWASVVPRHRRPRVQPDGLASSVWIRG